MNKERRDPAASRLRIYFDAIRAAENTSDEEWLDTWAKNCTPDSVYMSKALWTQMLRTWALAEAERLSIKIPLT